MPRVESSPKQPPPTMPNLFEEFRGVVTAMTAGGVPFAVCGGIADIAILEQEG